MLEKRGFTAEVMATDGAPVVFAERKGKSDKTLLIYNHYDVQPPEPLELWESPPFEPEIRNGKMYGRGVSDDKSHLTARLHAIDAILDDEGELPCNIKFIIEGEEETASVHLHDLSRRILTDSKPMPAFGNSAAWIIAISPCNISACAAFAMLSCPSLRSGPMSIRGWVAVSCLTRRGDSLGH
jgi:acetylornithine deacetylase/succinyl-diaminopimelate desuccinylase-like protein